MTRGGKRAGAGRKPGRTIYSKRFKELVKRYFGEAKKRTRWHRPDKECFEEVSHRLALRTKLKVRKQITPRAVQYMIRNS